MQKTMLAQPSPFGNMPPGGGMQATLPQGGMPQGAPPGPQGFTQASPMQKTIVAGIAPPLGQPGMPGMPGQLPGQMPPGYPMPPGGGPNKTVLLQPTEGVVSVARSGGAVQPAGTGAIQQGASTLFWIVSLMIGVAVGALAYVVVLQL
jgi:hypothetical protein